MLAKDDVDAGDDEVDQQNQEPSYTKTFGQTLEYRDKRNVDTFKIDKDSIKNKLQLKNAPKSSQPRPPKDHYSYFFQGFVQFL